MSLLRTLRDKPKDRVSSRLIRRIYRSHEEPRELKSPCATCHFAWSNGWAANAPTCRAGVPICSPGYKPTGNLEVWPAADGECPSYLTRERSYDRPPSHLVIIEIDSGVVMSVTPIDEYEGHHSVWAVDTRRQPVPHVGASVTFEDADEPRTCRLRWREHLNRYTDKVGRTRYAVGEWYSDASTARRESIR